MNDEQVVTSDWWFGKSASYDGRLVVLDRLCKLPFPPLPLPFFPPPFLGEREGRRDWTRKDAKQPASPSPGQRPGNKGQSETTG